MNSFQYDFQISKENSGLFKVDRFDVIGDEASDSYEEAT